MASELHSWLSHWMLIVFVLSILLILTFNKALLILVQRMTEYAFRALLSWLAISCTCMYYYLALLLGLRADPTKYCTWLIALA